MLIYTRFFKKNQHFQKYFGTPSETENIAKDPGNERFRMRSDSTKIFMKKYLKSKKLQHCDPGRKKYIDKDHMITKSQHVGFQRISYDFCNFRIRISPPKNNIFHPVFFSWQGMILQLRFLTLITSDFHRREKVRVYSHVP